jgi:alpha-glucoside transport system permease protein
LVASVFPAAVLASTLSDSVSKLTGVVEVVGGFLAIVLLIFYFAGRATGRFQRPLTIFFCLGPALVLLVVGLVIPAIRTMYLSLRSSSSSKSVGFKNYYWVFTDPNNRSILIRTAEWLIVAPLFATGFGLLVALLVDRMKRPNIAKSLIFLPTAISFVGASIIWKFVYTSRDPSQPQIGLLSEVAIKLGWHHPPNWLLSTPLNTFLLMVIMIWIQTGFAMVVLAAALKGIPDEILEAARVDGAVGFKLFRTVQVPMIRGTLIVVLTTIMIATLKVFDIVRTVTGGNFGTQVLSNKMYSETFVNFEIGRGSALAVVLFLAVTPLVAYNVVQMRRDRATR